MYNEQESLEILYQELNRVTDTITVLSKAAD